MIPVPGFEKRRVAVFGLGKSGLATVRALEAGGAEVLAWDDSEAKREEAREAGVQLSDCDSWDWKSIAVHYQFHRIDVRYRRVMNIRGLGEVQKMLQLSMTRIDENGDQQVDAQTHDRFLKTYKEHSREISLLQDANLAARPRGAR